MPANQFEKKSEAWSARFSEPTSELVKRYTASVAFDQRLWRADIEGSLAHAAMLADRGVITAADLAAIRRAMTTITEEIERGTFQWKVDLEDVHLNIEARLVELAGDAGKRLHTGRSRNDQVATDIRLWLRDEIEAIGMLLGDVQRALVELAAQHTETILPGFTHLQVAQPVSFAHHLLAYVEMLARDGERMGEVRSRTNRLPLGAAALAGTSFPLDREAVAKALRMEGVCLNSIDAVSDRDFAIEFASAASLAMVHLSRFSEELVLWSSQSFGFIELADRFCTGSSIMPQKKNPDVPELARGKTGRVVGHLMGLLMLMKGQPLAYRANSACLDSNLKERLANTRTDEPLMAPLQRLRSSIVLQSTRCFETKPVRHIPPARELGGSPLPLLKVVVPERAPATSSVARCRRLIDAGALFTVEFRSVPTALD
jgi:argininosuccinate lyase